MESLKEKNAVLEKTNQNVKYTYTLHFILINIKSCNVNNINFVQITEELNVARDSVIDLQQKITVLERVQVLQTNDKTHEKFLKQAQEKHTVEMKNMQTQIDVLTDKLNVKVSSNSLFKLFFIFRIYIFSIIIFATAAQYGHQQQ